MWFYVRFVVDCVRWAAKGSLTSSVAMSCGLGGSLFGILLQAINVDVTPENWLARGGLIILGVLGAFTLRFVCRLALSPLVLAKRALDESAILQEKLVALSSPAVRLEFDPEPRPRIELYDNARREFLVGTIENIGAFEIKEVKFQLIMTSPSSGVVGEIVHPMPLFRLLRGESRRFEIIVITPTDTKEPSLIFCYHRFSDDHRFEPSPAGFRLDRPTYTATLVALTDGAAPAKMNLRFVQDGRKWIVSRASDH